MALVFLAMIIQEAILTFALTVIGRVGGRMKNDMMVSLMYGLFLAAYVALAEPAKYAAPSILSWFLTEGIASSIQFVIFGVVPGFIHRRFA